MALRGNEAFERANTRVFGMTHAGLKQRALLPLLTGLAYYLAALLGVAVSASSDGVSLFWLPNGIVLAVLLMVERRAWLRHLAAAVLAEVLADLPTFTLTQSLIFAGANVLECVLAALLLQGVARPFRLDRLHHLFMFGLYALVVACGIASLGGSLLYEATLPSASSFFGTWMTWWLGDAMGMLLVTPLLLGWLQGVRPSVPGRRLEAVALFGLTLTLALTIFLQDATPDEVSTRRPYLLMALSSWAAVRFGVRGASTIGLLVAGVSIAATLGGYGPFLASPRRTVLLLQEYLAVQLLSTLALAALLQELRDRNDQLRLRERALDAISDGVVIVDVRTPGVPVVFSNPAYAAKADACDGFLHACRLDGTSDPKHVELCSALREGRSGRDLLKQGDLGAENWNDLQVAPVRDGHGHVTHCVAVIHDLTEMKRNETELRATHEQLDGLNRELEMRVQARTRELEAANRRLEELASTDTLTGASNRRHFLEEARKEISRAKRLGTPLSTIMIDVDLFKGINDRHGHEAGDRVLTALAKTVRAALREGDMFARLGGEEFIVMLSGQGVDEALRMAERLRGLVAAMHDPELPEGITISLGVAGFDGEADRIEDLLRRADQALYEAKRRGRNRVCQNPAAP